MSAAAASDHAELVFGLVYGVGTDSDEVIRVLEDYLRQFKYRPQSFRISEYLSSLDLGIEFDEGYQSARMHALMDAGNEARSRTGSDEILAVSAINNILSHREKDEKDNRRPSFNVAHIIRSLKRPEEVALLRQVYRPGFYLIGIAADDDEQRSFLTERRGVSEDEAKRLIERDQDEQKTHGQRTRDTFYLSDVFLRLRGAQYKSQLRRFLELIFGRPFITPTREEHAMFMAYASSARSAQLGRQVGSAIATTAGEVTAVGFNEVPSKRGSPYWEGDQDDHRDHREDKDSNYEYRQRIIDSILERIGSAVLDEHRLTELVQSALTGFDELRPRLGGLVQAILQEFRTKKVIMSGPELRQAVEKSDIAEVTEFGRAVHAEMDAVLTCARLGIETKGKLLYTTTFPCHNCTRHIIAAGIAKVTYIEPYPKSKARDLHSDAICFDENEAKSTGKIPFVPFVGVGPRRYLDLFSLRLTTGSFVERRGPDGKPIKWQKVLHTGPVVPMEPYSYLEREEKALDEAKAKLRSLARSEDLTNG